MTSHSAPQGDSGTPVLGAGGVVFGPGGVLLVRYRSGAWAFPKGHVEPGETLLQTALREVQEEGGVSASVLHPLTITRYTNDRGVSREIHWYAMQTLGTPVLEDTFSEGGFFAPEEAAQMLSYPEDRQLLLQALHLMNATP
ncbi:NUDIX hydrolase [Deinococcus radiomollis]|uniref:NUDIX hydrolase n=1 Tax=Deinococcus radiomollis TaxID=468916 RepID=UPI003891323B